MKKDLYYFAYGSNLLFKRIKLRLGKAPKKEAIIALEDYKLVFDCGYASHSYANIQPCKGDKVEGVLYRVKDSDIVALDRYEGYPFNYVKEYFLIDDRLCFAYVGGKYFNSIAYPEMGYLDVVIEGCKENNLAYTLDKLLDFKKNLEEVIATKEKDDTSLLSSYRKKYKDKGYVAESVDEYWYRYNTDAWSPKETCEEKEKKRIYCYVGGKGLTEDEYDNYVIDRERKKREDNLKNKAIF